MLAADGSDGLRNTLQTNLHGMLDVRRASASVLKKNGGGALVNMLSAPNSLSVPDSGT